MLSGFIFCQIVPQSGNEHCIWNHWKVSRRESQKGFSSTIDFGYDCGGKLADGCHWHAGGGVVPPQCDSVNTGSGNRSFALYGSWRNACGLLHKYSAYGSHVCGQYRCNRCVSDTDRRNQPA